MNFSVGRAESCEWVSHKSCSALPRYRFPTYKHSFSSQYAFFWLHPFSSRVRQLCQWLQKIVASGCSSSLCVGLHVCAFASVSWVSCVCVWVCGWSLSTHHCGFAWLFPRCTQFVYTHTALRDCDATQLRSTTSVAPSTHKCGFIQSRLCTFIGASHSSGWPVENCLSYITLPTLPPAGPARLATYLRLYRPSVNTMRLIGRSVWQAWGVSFMIAMQPCPQGPRRLDEDNIASG